MLNVARTPALMALHEAILGIAAQARDNTDGDHFGSPYIRDRFTPHISLDKINHDEQAKATAIGRKVLSQPAATPSRALDLCDIGEYSQRWDVFATFPASESPKTRQC